MLILEPLTNVAARDLLVSIAGLGIVVLAALIGLATDDNWPKVLRVALAFATYAVSCIVLFRVAGKRLRYWIFASSAALSALVSVSLNRSYGLIPAATFPRTLAVSAAVAALLLGGVHYLGLRFWRRLGP